MSANPLWGGDWEEVRRLWLLDPEVAHCDRGSFGGVPAPVLATQDDHRSRMAPTRVTGFTTTCPVWSPTSVVRWPG